VFVHQREDPQKDGASLCVPERPVGWSRARGCGQRDRL